MTSARGEAILDAQRLLQLRPVYLDTETTGLGPDAEIIEIGIIDHDGSLLYSSLVRPKSSRIEPDAQRLHGITLQHLQDAPDWNKVWIQVQTLLSGRRVGVYNAEFDLRLMRQSHKKYFLPWTVPEQDFACIMKLYARFRGEWDSRRGSFRYQSLDSAGQQCGIRIPNSHRAIEDARLARAVLEHIASQAAR